MDFDEFFRAFYIGGNDGHLKGFTTTWSIPKFFAESVLRDEKSREKLPQDDMSYDKWFQGSSSPRNHWANFAKNYKEDLLVADLMATIDETNIRGLLSNFGINDDNEINKRLLCSAIAQQFKEIIDGKGKGRNVVADIYLSGNIKADFTEYIDKAVRRYNVMKLIGGDEVPLEDFFVSNTIGEKERVFADKKRIKCVYLEEPSLESIRGMYSKRKYDNLKTVLIGSGGCGKSLMLQHLFLQAAEKYKKTGILPVFLELRYFTQNDDLLSFIVKTVSDKDRRFSEDVAKRLLLSGRCQLLLDGFDEIDPSDVADFLVKLERFSDLYDKVQIVISSRENESLTGLHNYIKLYMWPFDTAQSEKLIDKILAYRGEEENRDTVLEYINNGFLKKDGIFASHPLLLTFVTLKYPAYKKFGANHLQFYKSAYEALLSGHDDNKKPYDRVFMSVDNAAQFSTVFKEFCAITFKDGALQFDSTSFETYFNQLKSHKAFENPNKMNVQNFKHDVCSTACMMYEREYDIYYIDPGFQEFLFAEYYTQADLEELKPLVDSLKRLPYSKVLRFEALDMLNNRSTEKFRLHVLLPFLDEIFKGSDEQSFMRFLESCFSEIQISFHDKQLEAKVSSENGTSRFLYHQTENHSSTILLDYILKLINGDDECTFSLDSGLPAQMKDEYEETGKLIGEVVELNDERVLLIDCKPIDQYELIKITHDQGYKNDWLIDENGKLICFGSRAKIDTYYLNEYPDDYIDLIRDIIANSRGTYNVFLKIKKFHTELKKERHRCER